MKDWTEAAEMRLEEYLRERVAREQMHGEEAIELKEDLRRHIHEEVQHDEGIATCGLMQLEQVLGKLDAGYKPAPVPSAVVEKPKPSAFRRGSMMFFAVILPLLIVLFEWVTNFCGATFFDPIPTPVHGLLLLAVPLLNAWLLRTVEQPSLEHPKRRAIAAGLSFGVSAFYGLLFLPLVPLSVMALMAFGMGLLSLSPIIAWLCSWLLSRKEKGKALLFGSANFGRWWWTSVLVVLGLLMIYEVPALWTRTQVSRALSNEEEQRVAAVESLRAWHSERTLLAQCYEDPMMMNGGDISSWMIDGAPQVLSFGNIRPETLDRQQVCDLYFRVTGEPFNAKRPPHWSKKSMVSPFGGRSLMGDEWDAAHGGDLVAGKTELLDCKESRFDGHLDGKARIGYGEWTLVFQNQGTVAREARCQMRLPRGGQVSRLTLWINGEPREAAFGSVSQVKAAYKEVAVVQRRDPVLVNMVGSDTFMVQCFPVPANGEMKIRIGVTAPFEGDQWRLPRIIEQNFGEVPQLTHALWMQADRKFSCVGQEWASHADGDMQSLSQSAKSMSLTFRFDQPSDEMQAVWCQDPIASPEQSILLGQPTAAKKAAVDTCVVVIDGSQSLQKHREWISRSLAGKAVKILLATDAVVPVTAEKIANHEFRGGCDNEPALFEALRLAKESAHGAVIWLHGSQPVDLCQSERLLQLLERGSNRPDLYAVPVVDGANRLFEKLGRTGNMQASPSDAASETGLTAWNERMQQGENVVTWQWSRHVDAVGMTGVKVSDQLARLWAMEEVMKTRDGALATKYQLVSYVSGAIVLETQEQYDRHGLKPVDANSAPAVPNVPEPSSALLILLGVMAACLRRKRG